MSARADRIIVLTHVVCLVPALVASGWVYLSLQWVLPTEGGTLEAFALLCGLLLVGIVLGNSHRPALTRRAAWLLRAAAVFSFARLCFWFDHLAWSVRLADTVPVAAGYVLGRIWAFFFRGEWWIPFVVSLVPPLLAFALIKPDTKQAWPWGSFQTQILALLNPRWTGSIYRATAR